MWVPRRCRAMSSAYFVDNATTFYHSFGSNYHQINSLHDKPVAASGSILYSLQQFYPTAESSITFDLIDTASSHDCIFFLLMP